MVIQGPSGHAGPLDDLFNRRLGVAVLGEQLSGDGDGPTLFEYTNEFEVPGGRLGNVASRVIVGATSEREAKSSLKRLKALVERS